MKTPFPWGKRPACQARGFTLVELLVVIGIIGLLAALLTPVVMQSLTKARNAAIKAEIDMLHMAIMNYKTEYGSFPPCFDAGLTSSNLVNRHLQRLFPRASAAALASPTQAGLIRPATAIVVWLTGYTDDPSDPIANLTTTLKRNKLFDFDTSRVSSYQYAPSGKSNSPYIYIPNSQYTQYAYLTGSLNTAGAQRTPSSPPLTNSAADFATASASAVSPPFANSDSFQILCAGRDEQFGTDDDLSNFWPGTRREYLDSLKD